MEAYDLIEKLLDQTKKMIDVCGCESGCPSCVHSPKCGSGNRPIDKKASLVLLDMILSDAIELSPKASGNLSGKGSDDARMLRSEAFPTAGDESSPAGRAALPERFAVFDLETKRSAEEVGGWHRADKMGLSVAVVYDSALDGCVAYLEEETGALIEHLEGVDLIVGFNIKRFDFRVLSHYADFDFNHLPVIDLLEEIQAYLGYRLSLDRLAAETLGRSKSADGLQALEWYRQGKIKEIAAYCKKDVELTKDLFLHALEHGFLLFKNRAKASVRLPLQLDGKIWALRRIRGSVEK
jgi:DEAD/DEAH box helicase domain-containing protein